MHPAYFFDELTLDEAAAYLDGLRRRDLFQLRRTRLLMWAVLQSQCRREIDPEEILPLDGDEEAGERETGTSAEELELLRERAKRFENE